MTKPTITSTRKIANKVKTLVDSRMVWTDDMTVHHEVEHWTSHADAILSGGKHKILDDCDGFALTSADLLIEEGIAEEDIRIVHCFVKDAGHHLICCVDDDEADDTYVLCNIQRFVVSHSYLPDYDFISSMRYDEKGIWRDIKTGDKYDWMQPARIY